MKILKKIIIGIVFFCVLAVIVIACLWLLNSPERFADKSQSKLTLEQAHYPIAKMNVSIIDDTRDTQALGGFEGDNKRVLNGSIWFPEGDSLGHPFIIYSHGFGGFHKESEHIVEYLVSNGYVVAAVNFPLSHRASPAGVPQLVDVVNQPGDVTVVIDKVLSLNNDPNSLLYNRVLPNKIGAMGLSLGGLTTALVSFHPDLKDERISTAVMMAPPLESFSEAFYANNTKVKSLIMSGTMDRVVPELANATHVKARHPKGWFISLNRGTHLGFANIGNPLRWVENPDNVGCALLTMMLSKLDLPDRWDAVLANTDGVLRDVDVGAPCPEIKGKSMNALKQQWLTRIAVGAFFDMHLRSGERAVSANDFFTVQLSSENRQVNLSAPR